MDLEALFVAAPGWLTRFSRGKLSGRKLWNSERVTLNVSIERAKTKPPQTFMAGSDLAFPRLGKSSFWGAKAGPMLYRIACLRLCADGTTTNSSGGLQEGRNRLIKSKGWKLLAAYRLGCCGCSCWTTAIFSRRSAGAFWAAGGPPSLLVLEMKLKNEHGICSTLQSYLEGPASWRSLNWKSMGTAARRPACSFDWKAKHNTFPFILSFLSLKILFSSRFEK